MSIFSHGILVTILYIIGFFLASILAAVILAFLVIGLWHVLRHLAHWLKWGLIYAFSVRKLNLGLPVVYVAVMYVLFEMELAENKALAYGLFGLIMAGVAVGWVINIKKHQKRRKSIKERRKEINEKSLASITSFLNKYNSKAISIQTMQTREEQGASRVISQIKIPRMRALVCEDAANAIAASTSLAELIQGLESFGYSVDASPTHTYISVRHPEYKEKDGRLLPVRIGIDAKGGRSTRDEILTQLAKNKVSGRHAPKSSSALVMAVARSSVESKKTVQCRLCTGHYIIRTGKYGDFAGCSNYPPCESTMELHTLVLAFLQKYGLSIYQWEIECWKCNRRTKVYSYYLGYELEELDEFLAYKCSSIGLGDINHVDKILSRKFPTIQMKYSYSTKSQYMANTCEYCSALQGKNYIVDDPHKIIGELWHDRGMDKYKIMTITFESTNSLRKDIRRVFIDDE